MATFVVETEGYNDGLPYEKARSSDRVWIVNELKLQREINTKVRHRLIKIEEDYS